MAYSGVKYYTSKRDQTSLSCSVRIRARHVWNAWRGTVIGASDQFHVPTDWMLIPFL